CRDDESKGRSPSDGPATLLHARSAFKGRPPRLCIENALHPRKAARTIRAHELAASPFGGHCAEPKSRSTNRHRGARTRDVALDRPVRRPARGNCSHREVESLLCESPGTKGRAQGFTWLENSMLRTIE